LRASNSNALVGHYSTSRHFKERPCLFWLVQSAFPISETAATPEELAGVSIADLLKSAGG
jgi:hypothetical protein